MITTEARNTIEVPRKMTCFKLNEDGTSEMCDERYANIYIDERQVSKIWDPQVAKFIREKYGCLVGVMHFMSESIGARVYPTFKYVLGG